MRRLRGPVLVAMALLVAGALLGRLGEGARPAAARAAVEFPRAPRQADVERMQARRTLPALATLPGPPVAPAPRADPFLVALPRDPQQPLVVLEANALRHSRIGELFVACTLRSSRADPFEEARREVGIDPLKDIDRVAATGEGLVISGFFEKARFDRLEQESRVIRRGERGLVYEPRDAPGGAAARAVGRWADELVVVGSIPFVEATLDRLDGRSPPGEPVLPEHLTYGEAYGVVPGAALQALFRGGQSGLGQRLAEVASRIELHVDAMRDIALVARVSGEDAAAVDDLGKAFGAALSVARLEAAARGDAKQAELLEHARVVRAGEGFSLELALPIEVVERWFAECGGDARGE